MNKLYFLLKGKVFFFQRQIKQMITNIKTFISDFFQESSSPALDCPIQDFVEKFQKTFANQSEPPVSTISV